MKIIAAALLFISGFSYAGDFTSRVAEAKSALATPEGKKYELTLGPSVQKAIQFCIPLGSTAPENLGKFTLVGYVSNTGTPSALEAQPTTKISQCFAQSFGESPLPIPPKVMATDLGFPFIVEMSITP